MNGRAMRGWSAVLAWGLLVAVALGQVGEQRSGPEGPRILPPQIDANKAAAAAMLEYDKNKDGSIRGPELDGAPELKAAMGKLDANHDGAVSAAEIVARIKAWKDSKAGLMTAACKVQHKGRPLAGARVVWEPAAWLGESVKSGEGTTDARGMASITIPKSALPGVAPGLYRVKITHPEIKLPKEFNEKTVLGIEVAMDAEWCESGFARFDLQAPHVDAPRSPDAR